MGTSLRRALFVLASLAALAGCRSGRDECDKCSSDDDCRSGFVCSTFDDGTKRCGSGIGFTQCGTVSGGRTRPVLSVPRPPDSATPDP